MSAGFWSRWILRGNAVILMGALPAIFMPFSWMDHTHHALGLGPLPDIPLTQYLARSISALYTILGVGTWYLAADVRRDAPLVRLWCHGCIVFGAALLVIDEKNNR